MTCAGLREGDGAGAGLSVDPAKETRNSFNLSLYTELPEQVSVSSHLSYPECSTSQPKHALRRAGQSLWDAGRERGLLSWG